MDSNEEEDFPTAELDDPIWSEEPITNRQQLCIHQILHYTPRTATPASQTIQEEVLPEPEQMDIEILGDLPDVIHVPKELSSDFVRLGSLKPARRTTLAAERLAALHWLERVQGEPVYLVGGAWRAMARLRMAAEQHPIAVVHHYRMAAAEAGKAARAFAAADPATLKPGPEGMWPRRLATVPSGASVLIALLESARPSDVLFSAFGLREGLLFDRLPQAVRAQDPLHDACRAIARRDGRSLAYAEALQSWLARATLPALEAHRGMLPAAAFLSEIAWRQHPDLRAADAFQRIARAPFVGIDHPGRVFLALAVAQRYKSALPAEADHAASRLLPNGAEAEARALGLTLRLAERLSCGEPAVLDGSRLVAEGDRLVLRIAPAHRPLVSGKAQSAADALARALGCTLSLETAN